jgi:hypothetical protein
MGLNNQLSDDFEDFTEDYFGEVATPYTLFLKGNLISSIRSNTFIINELLSLLIFVNTLGISSLILNVIVLYIFEQTVNYLDLGITVQLGALTQTFILSVILSAIYFLIKRII